MSPCVGAALISPEAIARRISEMGRQISTDYSGRALTVVGVLKGSFVFVADLIRAIDPGIPIEIDFISASSYGAGMKSGPLHILKDLEQPVAGKNVLLAEDIVDSGSTLQYVYHLLAGRNPASLRVATLLEKTEPRRVYSGPLDYVGFQLKSNLFAVGYGLDYAERYRNLPGVHRLEGVAQV